MVFVFCANQVDFDYSEIRHFCYFTASLQHFFFHYIMHQLVIIACILLFFVLIIGRIRCSDNSNNIKTLVRQSARWAVAAEQDKNIMIAVLHANYAAGYLWALADIYTSQEIEQATGIDYMRFRDAIIGIQDKTSKRLATACPDFVPKKTFLSTVAGKN